MDEPPHKIPRPSNPVLRCQDCYIPQSECWIRHYFLLNSIIRRFCTNCVLKNSLDGFCPVCFEVYEDSTAPPCPEQVMCSKCPSISHQSCISSGFDSTYLCPLCSDRNFAFFNLGRSEAGRIIDLKSSKVLLVAATFAAQSMRKAVAEARAVADKKIEMAVIARKEAIRALERFAFTDQPEKVRKESANRNSNKDDDSKADTNGDDDSISISDTNAEADDSKANSLSSRYDAFYEELAKMLEFDLKADTNRDDDSKANSKTNVDADSKADSLSSGDDAFSEELAKMLEFDLKADTIRDGDSKANSDTNVDADSKADSLSSGDDAFSEELAKMLEFDSKVDTNVDDDSKANSDINVDADSNGGNKSSGDDAFAEELAKMLDFDSEDDN